MDDPETINGSATYIRMGMTIAKDIKMNLITSERKGSFLGAFLGVGGDWSVREVSFSISDIIRHNRGLTQEKITAVLNLPTRLFLSLVIGFGFCV